ncbi:MULTISPECIES: hypothetical protein [Anoxybacillaceae]|nr:MULTISPECIES: hypothetical protein [Bacillaceae]MED4990300.1 hypothetical protein [Parageobacillus toebii]WMT18359.1 hypothetical protein RFB12_13815 [Parageobacillus toebii]
MMTMPGLPKQPAALRMNVDENGMLSVYFKGEIGCLIQLYLII